MNQGAWLFVLGVTELMACHHRVLMSGEDAAGGGSALGVGGASGASGAGGGGFAGAAGTSGGGGSDAGGAGATAHGVCRALDPNPDIRRMACEGIEALVLSNPRVRDDGMDGALSPGEGATIDVALTNTGDKTFYIPCVGIAPAPFVPDGAAPADQAFGSAPPGQTQTLSPHIVVSASTPPGTALSLTAYVAIAGADCTNVNNLAFSVNVTR
jgi:hypothetical protein